MTANDIKRLQEVRGYPCVSIYVPTHRSVPDRQKDPILIKNAINSVVERLIKELPKNEIDKLILALEKVQGSIDYTNLLDGLVIFAHGDWAEVYVVSFPITEKIVIDDTFLIRDLVYGLNKLPQYWVLALSEKPTRLFLGLGESLTEIVDPKEERQKENGFPFERPYDVTSDRELHAVETGAKDSGYLTEREKKFYNDIDKVLGVRIGTDLELPIVLLGTTEARAGFLAQTKHTSSIVAQGDGDFNKSSVQEVLKTAYPLIGDCLHKKAQEKASRFNDTALGDQKKHAFGIKDVWRKAYEGRVHELLVERDYHVMGIVDPYDPAELTIMTEAVPGAMEDVVDEIVELVKAKGNANVYFVDPGSLDARFSKIGAILRY